MFIMTVKHNKGIPPSVTRLCPSQCIGNSVSKFRAKNSISDTLLIFLCKSIRDNTVDTGKIAAILDTSILTSLKTARIRVWKNTCLGQPGHIVTLMFTCRLLGDQCDHLESQTQWTVTAMQSKPTE